MNFSSINLNGMRVFSQVKFLLHPRINIITGPNGVGKTSLLEAVYLLTCARSFRTRDTKPLITYGQSAFSLSGMLSDGQSVSLKKSLHDPVSLRINAKPCSSTSVLAKMIPSQIFYQDIFQLIDAGSTVRRGFLNWGLFHVKHEYLDLMKQYQRILKQRNALLRMNADNQSFYPWEEMLSNIGEQLHVMRKAYIVQLNAVFKETLPKLSELICSIQYEKGWGKRHSKKTFFEVLNESRDDDRRYQYTRFGPHHADIHFHTEDKKVKHYFSRGQQKILLIALKLSQAQLLNSTCTFLMDDIITELDSTHLARLFEQVAHTPGQFFMTCHVAENIKKYILKEDCQEINLA